ncbi:B12-binding domain-containing protein [Candidatus Bipolaricaulota bacterium]|nr:B12-binding domain-containing protein [Candidatus Bipolaricaulota bacterium]
MVVVLRGFTDRRNQHGGRETIWPKQEALDEGLSTQEILNRALVPVMDMVGEQYECGEQYVPEMFLSAHAMKGAMEPLCPLLPEAGRNMMKRTPGCER